MEGIPVFKPLGTHDLQPDERTGKELVPDETNHKRIGRQEILANQTEAGHCHHPQDQPALFYYIWLAVKPFADRLNRARINHRKSDKLEGRQQVAPDRITDLDRLENGWRRNTSLPWPRRPEPRDR